MMRRTPLRRINLQFSQIRRTDARTFMKSPTPSDHGSQNSVIHKVPSAHCGRAESNHRPKTQLGWSSTLAVSHTTRTGPQKTLAGGQSITKQSHIARESRPISWVIRGADCTPDDTMGSEEYTESGVSSSTASPEFHKISENLSNLGVLPLRGH